MRYIPNTKKKIESMLREIGEASVDSLFSGIIPEELRFKRPLDIPPAMSEPDLMRHIKKVSSENVDPEETVSFLGGGAYNHFIPSAVRHLLGRSEFYTAYTPYQPEISQGTLQAIFEFQTFITQLTGMEVANASMYDGASALAEAVLLAVRVSGKREVYISRAVHPEYRETVKTYVQFLGIVITEIPLTRLGKTDLDWLEKNLSASVAAVVIQNPNFFGSVEELERVAGLKREAGVMFIGVVAEAVSLGILKSPGSFDADIVAGEAQSFGIPVSFGGPGVGFFATRRKFVRNMPGRVVGETVDANGKRGYVLTLSTREQHIRRERATSNICSNQSLCALAVTIQLTLLGRRGIRELAIQNLGLAAYARGRLGEIAGVNLPFSEYIFNEFVIELPVDVKEVNSRLLSLGIAGGLDLGRFYSGFENRMLVCVTEVVKKEDIDRFAAALSDIISDQI